MGKNNNNNNSSSSSEKSLQEQIAHLSNELEELRLEKEESKKNVLHFVQEADSARHELNLLKQQLFHHNNSSNKMSGCLSPPPEQEAVEQIENNNQPLLSHLMSRIRQLDKESLNALLEHVESIHQGQSESPFIQIDKLTLQLKESQDLLHSCKEQNQVLKTKMEQQSVEYTQLKRASLEETEKKIQSIKDESNKTIQSLREEIQQDAKRLDDDENELLLLQDKYKQIQEENEKEQHKTQEQLQTLQDKYDQLLKQQDAIKGQTHELEQSKMRENHLKMINRTLRDELRKPKPQAQTQAQPSQNQLQDQQLNIEYLRNVIIKFLEKRNARAQLIPVISMLLQCGQEDQLRLSRIIIKT